MEWSKLGFVKRLEEPLDRPGLGSNEKNSKTRSPRGWSHWTSVVFINTLGSSILQILPTCNYRGSLGEFECSIPISKAREFDNEMIRLGTYPSQNKQGALEAERCQMKWGLRSPDPLHRGHLARSSFLFLRISLTSCRNSPVLLICEENKSIPLPSYTIHQEARVYSSCNFLAAIQWDHKPKPSKRHSQ